MPATLLDLSLTGARVTTSRDIPASGNAVLAWDRFEAFCTIAWTQDERCGLDFEEPLHRHVLLATRILADTNPDRNSNHAAERAWQGASCSDYRNSPPSALAQYFCRTGSRFPNVA